MFQLIKINIPKYVKFNKNVNTNYYFFKLKITRSKVYLF